MLIVNKITKNEDGSYQANWNLSGEQMNFLLTFAINALVAQGLATIEEQEDIDDAQQQLDFLEDTDKDEMFQA
jgi:hypothetical protein